MDKDDELLLNWKWLLEVGENCLEIIGKEINQQLKVSWEEEEEEESDKIYEVKSFVQHN